MAKVSDKKIAEAISQSLEGLSVARETEAIKRIARYLYRRRLLGRAPGILSNLEEIQDEKEGRITARISSPVKITERAKDSMAHYLKRRYGAKHVEFNEKMDPSLIAGARVEVKDELMDFSAKSSINKLKNYLIAK